MSYSNIQRVRILYKTILKLHRGLPDELQVIGTKYARDEFRRHKTCSLSEAETFINEWTHYAIDLAKQLGIRGPLTSTTKTFGAPLSSCDLESLRDEQINQLYELMVAAKAEAEKVEQKS